MAGKGNAGDILKIAEKIIVSKKWKGFFVDFIFPWSFYSQEEYQPWVNAAGLFLDSIELVTKDRTLNNRESLRGWIKTT
jgi:hypothetical protein